METGRPCPSNKEEAHRATEQLKTSNVPSRGAERADTQFPEPQAWLLAPMLGGEPLMDDASIRDFNGGIGCQVASALEQTLLLLKDMVELRDFRRSEVFLHTKRFLGMVCSYFPWLFFFFVFFFYLFDTTLIPFFFFFFKAVQSTFKLEEMTNSLSQQLNEERKRRVAAVQTLIIAENSNTDLKKRLTAEEQAWKSANAALEGAEKQAESQRKLAHEANDQLAASKEQLAALKKQLEEA